jgi:urease accessory protein
MEIVERVLEAPAIDAELTLIFDARQRSRQRVRLDDGSEAMLWLPRGTILRDGDLLRAVDGCIVQVHAASEAVTTAATQDHLLLTRAAYHLGNRHVALQLGAGWLRYRCDHVLDDMASRIGLQLIYEDAPFEPEVGAYSGHEAHGH